MFACRAHAGCMHEHSFYCYIVEQPLESCHLLASCMDNYAGDAVQRYSMLNNHVAQHHLCIGHVCFMHVTEAAIAPLAMSGFGNQHCLLSPMVRLFMGGPILLHRGCKTDGLNLVTIVCHTVEVKYFIVYGLY